MAINWFPGHMNSAIREIRKAMRKADLIFEVLDARLPDSSENPLVASLRGDIPCVKILNKQDLADPRITAAWLDYLREKPGVRALGHDRSQAGPVHKLLIEARAVLPKANDPSRTFTAMIVGVPNAGKSTLINSLAGRSIARTANKPAVTRIQQRVKLGGGFALLDTPGILWPKLSPPACGFRLAISGAIPDTAVNYQDLAMYAAQWLAEDYPKALAARYKLAELPPTPQGIIDAIAARRACVRTGGLVDYQKASELLIREIRQGLLGPLSFERPPRRGHEGRAVEDPGERG